jgi:hypothetical protein
MSRYLPFALLGLACATPQPAAPRVEAKPSVRERTAAPPNAEAAALSPAKASAIAADADLHRIETLEKTRGLYVQFLERANGRQELEEATVRARERLQDLAQEMEFLKQGIAERRLKDLGQTEH